MAGQAGRTRISDVARGAGVSKTTVSFAFNSPDRVAPETAERVREVARQLGYEPHPVARMLAQRRTRTIGILTPQALASMFANPFFGTFCEGVARVAEAEGFGVSLISPLQGSLARALRRATVDGIVAIGLAADHPEIDEIHQAGVPTVLVDSTGHDGETVISIDDELAASRVADHLLALGHRRFLVIAGKPPWPQARPDPDGVMGRRLAGYRAALARAGVQLPEEAVVMSPVGILGGASAFAAAWADGQRPTAVLAMSDGIAIGAIQAARQTGLEVPADLSVVGFDASDLAGLMDPTLTTVRQPIRETGELATWLLVAAVGTPVSSNRPPEVPVPMVIQGASSGPVAMSPPQARVAGAPDRPRDPRGPGGWPAVPR